MLEIVYRDKYSIAINKPHGLLVHKTSIAKDAKFFALQELRNQIDQHVYTVHRLDRKTSGVLLFALNENTQKFLSKQFRDRLVVKEYISLVRGFVEDQGNIDYPLVNSKGVKQEAITSFETLERYEIPVPLGKHTTSRYSLLKIKPLTGRMHQIRKHMAHIFHPIIGDRPHGCNKQNKMWKEKWNMDTMLLHANELTVITESDKSAVKINAKLSNQFKSVLSFLRTNIGK